MTIVSGVTIVSGATIVRDDYRVRGDYCVRSAAGWVDVKWLPAAHQGSSGFSSQRGREEVVVEQILEALDQNVIRHCAVWPMVIQ